MNHQRDSFLKSFIRRSRLLSRLLDMICSFFIVTTTGIMLAFFNRYKDLKYDSPIQTDPSQIPLFQDTINLRPTYLLLGLSCASLVISTLVMLSYLRSHKLAGKVSLIGLSTEIAFAIILTIGCLYSASLFEIPKAQKRVRNDLWAASCLPLRDPKPGFEELPKKVLDILTPMCSSGDWSVICAFISGVLQGLIVITLTASLFRIGLKFNEKRRSTILSNT